MQTVEELFVAESLVWDLVLTGGRVIGTTAEHPFHVHGKDWMNANKLSVGNALTCKDGTSVKVEKIRDAGEWKKVYNIRVADFHTYFVGCDEWGFSVWAHYTCIYHYGVPGKTVLTKGSWVTTQSRPDYASAIAITFWSTGPDELAEYTIDLDLFPNQIVNWKG